MTAACTSPFMHPWFCAFMDMGPIVVPKLDWVIVLMSWYIRSNHIDPLSHQQLVRDLVSEYDLDDILFDRLLKYTLREIEWYNQLEAKFPGLNGHFKIQFDDKIVVSDCVVPTALKNDLKFHSIRLRNSFEDGLDCQGQTVHLVHPSLYPLQYGKSPIIRHNEVTVVRYTNKIANFKMGVSKHLYKKNFQWLPTLLEYHTGAQGYKIISYINNLHPVQFQPLYDIIESVFNLAVPGLELVLSRLQSEQITRVKIPNPFDPYDDPFQQEAKGLSAEDGDYNTRLNELKEAYVKPVRVNYEPPKTNHLNIRGLFKHLKVIPKLTNIELTPEHPEFKGGYWHNDGTINEDIVATIVYYYDSENISDSRISFKATSDEPLYEGDDEFYVERFYGLKENDPLSRVLGSVTCDEDSLIIFPNMFQNRLEPFKLHDNTKPGHRKMLCLYVVDPYNNLVVTTNEVPPQQRHWWDDKSLDDIIPSELKKQILSKTRKWPESIEQSKIIREQIRKERSSRDESDSSESDDEDDFLSPFQRCFHICNE